MGAKVKLQAWQWFLLGVLVAMLLAGGLTGCYQGRKISRWTGQPVHIKLPEEVHSYDQIVSISFHKDAEGETFKDVTFIGADGKLYSQEFNDWGILQGKIVWELQGE